MTLNNLRLDTLSPPVQLQDEFVKINQLQTDLLARARSYALDEVSAALTHQLNEPLTALLLYMHEIKEKNEHAVSTEIVPNVIQEMVENALREIQRVCDLLELLGRNFEAPVTTEAAINRGRTTIDWLAQNNVCANGNGGILSTNSKHKILTPREREVLTMITGGVSNKEGGYRLGISKRTFEVHRAHIMRKIGAKNVADLVRMTLSDHREV